MATIKDVAKHAGVSTTTVSNVLNKKSNISEDTYNRVTAAIKALDYHPSFCARGLKSKRVRLVGAVVPRLDGVYKSIINGILRVMDENGYHVIIKTTGDFANYEREALDQLMDIGVDGIFLVPCACEETAQYDEIVGQHVPIVFLERSLRSQDYTSVIFDNRNLVCTVVRELLDAGAAPEELLLITGNPAYDSEADCIRGAALAVEGRGEGAAIPSHAVSFDKEQSFYDLTELILALPVQPRHIIVSNEQITQSLCEVLAMNGLKSSHIHTLTGDDWQHFSKDPTLHCIPRPAVTCGKQSAALMIQYFSARKVYEDSQVVLHTTITDVNAERRRLQRVGGEQNTGRPLRLLLFHFCPMAEALTKIIPSFTTASGIEVEYDILSDQTQLYEKLLSVNKKRSDAYDVFMIDMPWLDYMASQGFLAPLGDYLQGEDDFSARFIPGVLDLFHRGSTIYGIPVSCGYQILLYRKDLFNDPALRRMYYKIYGIDLEVPRTWTEYNYIARFFTKSFNKESPLAYGTHLLGAFPNGMVEEFYPRQWSFKGRIADRTGVVIDSRDNVRALCNLVDTMQYSSSLAQDFSNDEHFLELANENAALINIYNIDVKSISDPAFDKTRDKIGYAPLPGKYSSRGGWTLAINAYCTQKDAAFSFIRWATSDDVAIHSTVLGGYVPKQYVFDNVELSNVYPWNQELKKHWDEPRMREQLTDRRGALLDAMKIDVIIADAVSDSLFHGVAPADALGRAKKRIEFELANSERYLHI